MGIAAAPGNHPLVAPGPRAPSAFRWDGGRVLAADGPATPLARRRSLDE